jgi:hypothetical protein
MIEKLLCLFDRHRPDRKGIQWEGICYTAHCKRCGEKIIRRKSTPCAGIEPYKPAALAEGVNRWEAASTEARGGLSNQFVLFDAIVAVARGFTSDHVTGVAAQQQL